MDIWIQQKNHLVQQLEQEQVCYLFSTCICNYYLIVKFYMFYKVFFIFNYFRDFDFLVFAWLPLTFTVIGQSYLMNIYYKYEILSSLNWITAYEGVVI